MAEKLFYIYSNEYSIEERKTVKQGKVYDIRFRVVEMATGKEKHKKLSGFKTKKLADKAYFDFVSEYCEHTKGNPIRKKDASKRKIILKELLEEYLLVSVRDGLKPSTIYSKRKIYDIFVIPYLGNKDLNELTKEVLREWQKTIKLLINPKTGKGYTAKYMLNIRGHFSAALTYAEKEYDIPNNFAKVEGFKRIDYDINKTSELDIWKKEDFEKFIAVVDNPMWHCLFTLLFFTGRRKGEAFALTPKDIHGSTIWFNKSVSRKTLDGETYNVVPTKEYKAQEVPICERLQKELECYKGESPFFFGGEKPVADNRTRRAFLYYCEKAKVEPIKIHGLRHSFVSMLIHKGAPVMMVADLIGDTPEQVTKTYGHLYQKDKQFMVSDL